MKVKGKKKGGKKISKKWYPSVNVSYETVKLAWNHVAKQTVHPCLLRNKVWLPRFKKFNLADGKQLCMNDLGHDYNMLKSLIKNVVNKDSYANEFSAGKMYVIKLINNLL